MRAKDQAISAIRTQASAHVRLAHAHLDEVYGRYKELSRKHYILESRGDGVNLCSVMQGSLLVYYLLLTLFCLQMNEALNCDFDDIDCQYSNLFLKLEEALLENETVINLLREKFMNTEVIEINFNVQLEVLNGTALSSTCDNSHHRKYYPYRPFNTFCPSNSSDHRWKLCDFPDDYHNKTYHNHNKTLQLTYRFPPLHNRIRKR